MTGDRSEHYYVVVAAWDPDTEAYRFRVDHDMADARFPDGSVWHGEEWRRDDTRNIDPLIFRVLADAVANVTVTDPAVTA